MVSTIKLFLASSSELQEDREQFEIFINRKNKDWNARGGFIELIVWEDFLDALSKTRLQDEYNQAIRECDLFLMLFFTKVGQYTAEEFEVAVGQFQVTRKPFIFTYFKDAAISTASADRDDLNSLWTFQDKRKKLGHFQTVYKNIDELKLKFNGELDKLASKGLIEFNPRQTDAAAPGATQQPRRGEPEEIESVIALHLKALATDLAGLKLGEIDASADHTRQSPLQLADIYVPLRYHA